MKNSRTIIKNVSLTLLFVVPIVLIIMASNGITLINNLSIYTYIIIYICIAIIYVKMKKDKDISTVVFILVAIYSIVFLYNYIGTYEINKSQNKNTIIVEQFDDNFFGGNPNGANAKFHKRVCVFFKKDLNAPVFHGRYDIYWEQDYIVIGGNAAKYFIESYETSEENSYFRNSLKNNNFEILPFNRIKINLNKT
ncbi:hypothetical protein [Clostridium sp.]|uniref:hypothetical protein n=1 Tax=Clostridium sp. TaxID=1506 RepID=UPI00321646B9